VDTGAGLRTPPGVARQRPQHDAAPPLTTGLVPTEPPPSIPEAKSNPRKERDSSTALVPQEPREQSTPPAPKRRGGVFRVICLLLACAIIGGGTGAYIAQMIVRDWEVTSVPVWTAPPATPAPIETPPPTPPPAQPRPDGALSAEEIYVIGRQQVVGIRAEAAGGSAAASIATGTGFILTADGYILTNYHVIEGGGRIFVTLEDGTVHDARLIGGEFGSTDLAVLKIDAEYLTPVTLGDFAATRVGARIYAIGNPLGELTYTITPGIVSALNREVALEEGQSIPMFQISASVNSGNSGGPVFNEFGEVIGIVTAKSNLDGVEGIGFAIPIDDAMRYAEQIIEHGEIPQPWLGIFPVTVSEAYAEQFNSVAGVFVNTVYANTPAERAGMQTGDVITAIENVPIFTVEELRALLSHFSPDDTIAITVFRDGEHIELPLTLVERPPDSAIQGDAPAGS